MIFSWISRPIHRVNRMASVFSAFDHSTRYAHRRGIGIFRFRLQKYRSFDYAKQLFTEAYKIPLVDPAVAARGS
jgi:hypothetical protein